MNTNSGCGDNKTDSLIQKTRKCNWFWGHNWGQWQRTHESDVRTKTGKEAEWRTTGFMFVQERKCQDCGFAEINKQEIET